MRFIKYLIAVFLVLLMIPINMLTNDLDGKFIMNNFINHFDSCFPTYLKEKIKGGNRHDFIFSSPLNLDTVSYDEFNEYYHCLSYIDTLLKNDSVFKNYFRDLLGDYYLFIEQIIYKNYYQYLHNLPYDFDHDIDSLREIKRLNDSIIIAIKTADSILGTYIPENPEEALDILDTLIPQEMIFEFKNCPDENKAVSSEHFGIGMFMRNHWRLGFSRLHSYFNQCGVRDPDAISSIILQIWYRRLNNKPLDLEKLIKERAEFEEIEKRFRETQGQPK